jgi:hypothetical protein
MNTKENIYNVLGSVMGFTGYIARTHHFDLLRYVDNGINALVTGALSGGAGYLVVWGLQRFTKKKS